MGIDRDFDNLSDKWTEEDILERLKDNAEDEHRNFIYPDMAQAILDLIAKLKKENAQLKGE